MTGTLPALAAALAAERPRADAALARAYGEGVEAAAVVGELAVWEPLLAAREPPGPLGVAVLETALSLAGAGRWRPGSAARRALCELAPSVPWYDRGDPAVTLAALVAAAVTLIRTGGYAAWAQALPRLPDPGPDIRPVLAVAAWRSGIARLRASAIEAAAALPATVAGPALRLAPGEVASALAANAADPWSWPGAPASGVLTRFGDYRGAGGPWLAPPTVGPGWTASADGRSWEVVADIHGGELVPLADPLAPTTVPGQLAAAVAQVVPWQDVITGVAEADGVVLVSRRHSYRLDVVRLP